MKMRDLRFDMFIPKGGTTCVQAARALQRYIDGDLNEPSRSRIAAHLAVCRRCGLDKAAYRDLKSALAQRAEPVPNEPIERLRAFAAELARQPPPTSP